MYMYIVHIATDKDRKIYLNVKISLSYVQLKDCYCQYFLSISACHERLLCTVLRGGKTLVRRIELCAFSPNLDCLIRSVDT